MPEKKYKPESYDPIKANKMIDYLESLPPTKWTFARDLAPICGIQETQRNNYSRIRSLARLVTKHNGIPIVAGNKGFKIAASQKEIDEYLKRHYSKIKGHHERIRNIKIAWDIYEPGKRDGIKGILGKKVIKKPKRFNLKTKKESKPKQQLFEWMEELK